MTGSSSERRKHGSVEHPVAPGTHVRRQRTEEADTSGKSSRVDHRPERQHYKHLPFGLQILQFLPAGQRRRHVHHHHGGLHLQGGGDEKTGWGPAAPAGRHAPPPGTCLLYRPFPDG